MTKSERLKSLYKQLESMDNNNDFSLQWVDDRRELLMQIDELEWETEELYE
ncbi:MAG: hypothetical protein GT601_17705 [Acidaminobacter sp.]|uniref:hypothetical protein n=1 Tax=Acidaminobacter sp. TaxID=1872102 RepID=UPI001380E255|nr:hypothetical protein [Acidaminobacter sp.]MZQ99506.1 hypothetical protein [Acidaminobacter sp.]